MGNKRKQSRQAYSPTTGTGDESAARMRGHRKEEILAATVVVWCIDFDIMQNVERQKGHCATQRGDWYRERSTS